VVATVRFYTRGVRAVHKTEQLSAAFGSITPVTPSDRTEPLRRRRQGRAPGARPYHLAASPIQNVGTTGFISETLSHDREGAPIQD